MYVEGVEEVYIKGEEEHYLHETPGHSPWEIGFDLTDDRGRVYCFQNRMQQQPIESVRVFTGHFRDRLPNGSYVEWLESLGAPVRELYYYVSLRVCTFHINELDEEWSFTVTGEDCVLARYVWNTRTQKLICTSPFVGDNEELTDEEFNERLRYFCAKHHLCVK